MYWEVIFVVFLSYELWVNEIFQRLLFRGFNVSKPYFVSSSYEQNYNLCIRKGSYVAM